MALRRLSRTAIFPPPPTARERPALVSSTAIDTIGDGHSRRNPLTSRSPGRGRLLLPPLLPRARRHPPPTLLVCSVSSRTNYPRPLHPPTIVGRRSNERAKTIRVSTPRLRSIGPEPPLGQRATGAADRHPRPRPAGARPRGADRRHRALARPEPDDPLGSVATVSTAGNRRDRR